MVRATCVDSNGLRKGAWTEEEDNKLKAYVLRHGHSNWRLLPNHAGLKRCGKSCRLRWMNYLKPGLKHGAYTHQEAQLIKTLHDQLGNKWSAIAAHLPGRTDNEIKNYWHTNFSRARTRRIPSKNDYYPETVGFVEEDVYIIESSSSSSDSGGATSSSSSSSFEDSFWNETLMMEEFHDFSLPLDAGIYSYNHFCSFDEDALQLFGH